MNTVTEKKLFIYYYSILNTENSLLHIKLIFVQYFLTSECAVKMS